MGRQSRESEKEVFNSNGFVVSRNFINIKCIQYRLKMILVSRWEPGAVARKQIETESG